MGGKYVYVGTIARMTKHDMILVTKKADEAQIEADRPHSCTESLLRMS